MRPSLRVASSWMRPAAKNQSLVYVSSVLTNDVYVYSLASRQPVGTLTGFSTPFGLCSDKSGDVWIANDGASELVEYAHGGAQPIATLADAGYYPEGCAVEPVTGNLALAAELFGSADRQLPLLRLRRQGQPFCRRMV